MTDKVSYDEIEWPVKRIEYTKIDEELHVKVKSEWYSKLDCVTIDTDGEEDKVGARLKMKPRDPEVFTIEELAQQTKEEKIKKRGKVRYQCPACEETFAPGCKSAAERHLNGSKNRKIVCKARTTDDNDSCDFVYPEPLIRLKD